MIEKLCLSHAREFYLCKEVAYDNTYVLIEPGSLLLFGGKVKYNYNMLIGPLDLSSSKSLKAFPGHKELKGTVAIAGALLERTEVALIREAPLIKTAKPIGGTELC